MQHDNVNHPKHYTSHPSGVECIQVTEHYNFNIGNAIKYLWRNGLKVEDGKELRDKQVEDLKKAAWYINREIEKLERTPVHFTPSTPINKACTVDPILVCVDECKNNHAECILKHTPKKCAFCFGKGWHDADGMQCSECKGTGTISN